MGDEGLYTACQDSTVDERFIVGSTMHNSSRILRNKDLGSDGWKMKERSLMRATGELWKGLEYC